MRTDRMHCARCGTKNSKTSKFCRECGRRFDLAAPQSVVEEEVGTVEQTQEADVQVGDLLFEAFRKYEHGEDDEAIKLCYEAVRMDSQSTSAHSLLGMIYEKKGDEDAAIRHYQRVLVINPKSIADREKLEELQKRKNPDVVRVVSLDERIRSYTKVAQEFLASKRPWPAAVGAALVTFLFLTVLWPNPPAKQSETQSQALEANQFSGTPLSPDQQSLPPTPPNSSGDLNFIGGGTRAAQPAQPTPQASNAPVESVRPLAAGSAPAPRLAPLPGTTRITDLPPIRIQPRQAPSQQQAGSVAAPAPQSGGIISIQKSPAPSTPATPAKSSVEQARSLQISGEYEGAIAAWRQALSGTKYPGDIHQQIATCYQRLGRHSDATASYQAAVRAYQQQIAAGYNVEEAQRGIRSSELAARISQREGG